MTTEKELLLTLSHFLTALKVFKTQRELHHCLTALKVSNTEKDSVAFLQFLLLHHYCLKVFNTKKGLHHFLRALKVFDIEKGLHHFLETFKGFDFEKWLRHILITRKVYQNSYSFFLSGFSFTHIHDPQDSRGRGRVSI